MWLLYILGAYFVLVALVELINRIGQIPFDINEKKRIEELSRMNEQREVELKKEREQFDIIKAESAIALDKISKEKALGFPWLASAFSEYHKLYDLKLANDLRTRSHPQNAPQSRFERWQSRKQPSAAKTKFFASYTVITKTFSPGL